MNAAPPRRHTLCAGLFRLARRRDDATAACSLQAGTSVPVRPPTSAGTARRDPLSSLKMGARAYAFASPTAMWRAGHTPRLIAVLNAVHVQWSVFAPGCPRDDAPAGVQPGGVSPGAPDPAAAGTERPPRSRYLFACGATA